MQLSESSGWLLGCFAVVREVWVVARCYVVARVLGGC